jgi:predicted enzyme related to lactoylglutathione lyase
MARVTGIGGVFFKARDKEATRKWLSDNLGLPTEEWGTVFNWRERDEPERKGQTVLGVFKPDSDHFDPSPHALMVNLRVDDMDAMLAQLREHGVEILKEFPVAPNGRFVHIMGPDGLKIELWEPVANDPYDP